MTITPRRQGSSFLFLIIKNYNLANTIARLLPSRNETTRPRRRQGGCDYYFVWAYSQVTCAGGIRGLALTRIYRISLNIAQLKAVSLFCPVCVYIESIERPIAKTFKE
jgi:hypothetical protein